MSQSKQFVELCALLVDENYGELTSRIFAVLLRKGRLPVTLLAKHTHLNGRQLKHGLVVLLQQGLVYYSNQGNYTHYEANYDAAYGLVRSGKIMDITESNFGPVAKALVQELFLLGHTKVSDIEEAYARKHGQNRSTNGVVNGDSSRNGRNGVNGHTKSFESLTGQLHTILGRLLEFGLIKPVTRKLFVSPSDAYNKAVKEFEEAHGGSSKSVKQKEAMKISVSEKLIEYDSAGGKWKNLKRGQANGRNANGSNTTQRIKITDDGEAVFRDQHVEDDGTRLDRDLVIGINYQKSTVLLRNQSLVAFADERIGETTSIVYAAGLKLLEDKIDRCQPISNSEDAANGPSFTVNELERELDVFFDVAAGVGKVRPKTTKRTINGASVDHESMEGNDSDEDHRANGKVNGTTNGRLNGNINAYGKRAAVDDPEDPFNEEPVIKSGKRPRVTFQDEDYSAKAPMDGRSRGEHIKQHLQLLSKDSCEFVTKAAVEGNTTWTVNFGKVVQAIQRIELDAIILEHFGVSGHRLARILRKHGKLDEKQLPNMALLSQKVVRTKLAEMQMAGMIEIQELPRDAARTTNRSLFLWYFDPQRVAIFTLDNMYKMMARCFQRLDVERRRAKEVLTLTERTDLQNQTEKEYCTPEQWIQLQQIRDMEGRLLGEIGRIDDLIGIFRDF